VSTDGGGPGNDLLVVGGGPTAIAIGAEAIKQGLRPLLVEKGPLLSSLLEFPRDMVFFTTRERLEIAGLPFAIPDPKPTRRQAVAYYHAVARAFELPLALHERVVSVTPGGEGFAVAIRSRQGERTRRARAVALATGYFDYPRRLGVRGEDLPLVAHRFVEPYAHFSERVVVVGGGNSALEAALELWRSGARVTLVHRGREPKPSVKYWLRPDFENRVAEGSVEAIYESTVVSFAPGEVVIDTPAGRSRLAADAVYVLIGYAPAVDLLVDAGIEVDPQTLVPSFDPQSCESNVPGLYVAGTLQAGRDTNRIFIENSRVHSRLIAAHLRARLRG
jgi:thioredoxin reductase (NADPH)